jgi:hypothetical protein
MMSKKLPESIDGYTREAINEFYDITLTDRQWELLVGYTKDPDPEHETTETLILDFIEKIDFLEESANEYDKLLVEFHGQEEADRINGN